jgi:predicted metalloprotease with PDZ domain
MSAVGHAFLLLPRLAGAVPARVRFHLGPFGRGAEAASSLGFGADVTTTATIEELGHAAYVAGKLWIEQPEKDAPAAEAGKSLVIVGGPPFDGRTAWRTCLATMAATDRIFGGPPEAGERFTFLLVPEPGIGRAHDGAHLTRSLGLWFDPRRGLDPEITLTIAHELTHRFLGGTVRLVDEGGRDAAWFSEGFTVHFARRALLDAGLATPADLIADVRRTLGEPAPGEAPLPADYRRGAQWAAYLDAALRRASGGARSLDDVARALVARARSEGATRLPVAALREALAKDLGPKGAADLDRLLAHPDAPVDLPDDAFGPCFKRTTRQESAFDLGFDRDGLHGGSGLVHGLVKGSAADRAGVREGALILSATIPGEDEALRQRAEVELLFADGKGQKRVRYRPVGKRTTARWETAPCAAAQPSPRTIDATR